MKDYEVKPVWNKKKTCKKRKHIDNNNSDYRIVESAIEGDPPKFGVIISSKKEYSEY